MDGDKIARALQGFGAGYRGRGGELLASRALQEDIRVKKSEKLDTKRRGAMLLDNRISLDHLKNGRVTEAIEHMKNRLPLIEQMGGDPSDTLERIQRLEAGDIDFVMNDAAMTDRAAVLGKELDPFPEQTAEKAQSQIGKLLSDRDLIAAKYGPDSKEVMQVSRRIAKLGEGDGKPAGQQEFESLISGLPEDQQEQARKIKLGLLPRAVGGAAKNVVIGGVDHTFDPINQTYVRAVVDGKDVTAQSVGNSEGLIAASKKAGEQAIARSGEAMDQLSKVKTSIVNIDEAIAALDKGANTGAIAQYLPSITNSSIELDSARKKMGLDIVGAASFGALSAGELKLALDVGMPSGMDEAGTKDWLSRKKVSQEKLSAELTKAAIYLGTPGNTAAGYMELMRNQKEAQDDSGPQEITSQQQFDALPSGATYLEDGVEYRKL